MPTTNLFTYGSLMFPEVWNAVAGKPFPSQKATLRGFRMFRVADADFPGILASDETDEVEGVIYFDIDPPTLSRLDQFEDVFYIRKSVTIDGIDCETYVVPREKRHVLSDEAWSASHFAEHDLDDFVRCCFGFKPK